MTLPPPRPPARKSTPPPHRRDVGASDPQSSPTPTPSPITKPGIPAPRAVDFSSSLPTAPMRTIARELPEPARKPTATRASRLKLKLVAVVFAALGGTVGALMHFLPAFVTTRHTYCTICALHHEESEQRTIFGARKTGNTREAVLYKLLSPQIGAHTHQWMNPAAFVFPTVPSKKLTARGDFQQAIAETEVRDLELLEESPHLLALLDEAMRNDKPRTLRFIQRVLDPKAHVGVEAIALLDRSTAWENRWAVVDAFFDVYRCHENEVSVSCRMRLESTDLLVLVRTAASVHSGGIDFQHWVPPGMKAPPGGGKPSNYAAVTLTN